MPVEIGPVIKVDGEAKYRTQLKNLIQQSKTFDAEMKQLEASFDAQTSAMEKSTKRGEMLTKQIQTQEQKVKELERSVAASEKATSENSTETLKWKEALANARTELSRLRDESAKLPTQLQLIGKSMQESGEKMQKVGQTMASIGQTMTTAVTVPILAAGTAAVKIAADFDSSMSQVAAVSGATGNDFDALRDKAREMGARTKFSATEAADAMNYMAMAGWKTEDMLSGIEGIMNLAAASGADLATTSDIVTDALTAFGQSAQESGRLADIMAAASSNANTNVEMMGETFKYAAPVAGALGFTMEDTAIAIGLMANAGVKASSAGTALRTGMTNLVKPTKQMQDAMEKYGIEVTNTDGSMKSFREIIELLRDRLGDLDEAEQAAAAGAIFGKNAMSGWLAIINGADADFEKLTTAVDESAGTAENMAAVMQDNLNGQLTILKSQLEELAISFGDLLVPHIRKAVTVIQGAVDSFNSMSDAQREGVIKMALFAASIGPVTLAAGKATEAIGGIVTGIGKFVELAGTSGTFTNLLVTNIGSIASGVGLVTAAVGVGVLAYEGWKNSAQGAAAESEKTLSALDKNHQANQIAVEDAQKLADRVKELASKESLTADETMELRSAVHKLNGIMPELNLQIDENTGNLDANSQAILQNIDASLAQYNVEKNKEELTALTEAYAEAEERLAQVQKERARAEKSTAADYGGDLQARTEDINRLKEAEESLIQTQGSIRTQYDGLMEQTTALQTSITNQTTAMDENAVSAAEASAALDTLETQEAELDTATATTTTDMQLAWEQAYASIYQSVNSQVGLFDALNVASDVNAQQMAANLATQTQAYNDYTSNLSYMMNLAAQDTSGNTAAIVQAIADMGIQGAGYLQELVNAAEKNDGSLQAILDNYGEAEAAKNKMVRALADMKTGGSDEVSGMVKDIRGQSGDASSATNEVVESAAEGIDSAEPAVDSATDKIVNDVKSMNTTLGSLASVSSAKARQIATNIATGLRSQNGSISTALSNIATTVRNGQSTIAGYGPAYYNAGSTIGAQLALGIGSQAGAVSSAVSSLMGKLAPGQSYYATYYNYGLEIGRGLASGMRVQQAAVESAAKLLADTIAKYLHHSTPDVGPLHGDDKWGGEFAQQIAKGMMDNRHELLRASDAMASTMAFTPMVGNSYEYGGFNITVNAAQGQSAADIADEVSRRINDAINRRKAVWA